MRVVIVILLALVTVSWGLVNKDAESTLQKGDKAPQIKAVSQFGEKISLSKLKGKIVLIDFWASWCRPCRRENPNVVKAYELFKDKSFNSGNGFEVFSISLDRDEVAWHKAITQDQLKWQNHAWDKDGVISKSYGVSSIPTAFLIDGKGKIIALGNELRGEGLVRNLRKYLVD